MLAQPGEEKVRGDPIASLWGSAAGEFQVVIRKRFFTGSVVEHCKDLKSTIACLKHCYYRRTLLWDKHRWEQQDGTDSEPGIIGIWLAHPE